MAAITFLTFVLCWLPQAWGAGTDVEPGSVSVVVTEHADQVEQFAAQELVRYLGLITGQKPQLGRVGVNHHIYLGEVPPSLSPAKGEELQQSLRSLREDGFILRRFGQDIVILGKGSRGLLYGCYAYLERQGVRWFFPGNEYEVIPHEKINWTASLNESESPAFRDRILFYWPNNYSSVADWIDFAAKARLNRIGFHFAWPASNWYINERSRLLPECRKRGLSIEVGGHFISYMFPRTLFTEHPDWFRLNEQGKRTNDFNLNPFNPEALDYLGKAAVNYLKQMPEASLYHFWPDDIDGGGWSHEPGKEEYTPSDQSLLVANSLVARLRKALPDSRLAFLAYHDTVYPPQIVKPQPGIVYFYAPRERCYRHAIHDPQCPLNQQYSRALEQALPAFGSANAEVFEYYLTENLYRNLTNPPLPEVLSADARYYHQLGIPAISVLMAQSSEFVSPATNAFLYPEALWNPERDLRASLKEYATLYFGNPDLTLYLRALEEGLGDVLKICNYQYPGDAWYFLDVDRESDDALAYHVRGIEEGLRGPLARASFLLDTAIQKAKSQVYRSRLEREKVTMDFTLIQSRFYYHLLKGEWLCRLAKQGQRPGADLDAAAEAVLARYTWEQLQRHVTRTGLKGTPRIPESTELESRVRKLFREETAAASVTSKINPQGFSVGHLAQLLMHGVGGTMAAGPSGSIAVLWTDLPGAGHDLHEGFPGLEWRDELGQPLSPANLDLFDTPVVIAAPGMSEDKLFDAVASSQRHNPGAVR